MPSELKMDLPTDDQKSIITAPIVVKNFIKKNGEPTDQKEFYIQRSIQDYFIKFCESKISSDNFKKHFSYNPDSLTVLTMEVEFREGNWDICDENELMQSRVGKYVVIHRIIDQ